MIFRTLGSILLAASALTSAGCPVASNDTDTATASTSSTTGEASTGTTGSAQTSSGTTADETGTPTTGPTSTGMTEAGTTGTTEAGTTGTTEADTTGTTAEGTTGTTAEGTTAESTTTGGANDLPASCDAACETLLGCDPEAYPDQASCVAECLDGQPNDAPECEAAAAVFNTCISGFDCKQLMAAMEDNEFGACTDAFQEYLQLCM